MSKLKVFVNKLWHALCISVISDSFNAPEESFVLLVVDESRATRQHHW
jgi:hypothetical protein